MVPRDAGRKEEIMVLTSGERAVWAAEYVRKRGERMAVLADEDLEFRESRGEALSPYQEAIQSAIGAAWGAVQDMRDELKEWLAVGAMDGDEKFAMLRAMLGEE